MNLPRFLAFICWWPLIGLAPADAAGVRDEQPVVMDPVVVDATKTHTLFMGADIAINLDRDNYPVHDVQGSNWVVVINGDNRVISAKKAPLSLQITPNLKLTEVSATISGFKRAAAYSFDNDPNVLLTRAQTQAGITNDNFQVIKANAEHMQDVENVNANGLNPFGGMVLQAQSDIQFGDAALMLTAKTSGAITHPGKVVPGSLSPPVSPISMGGVSGGGDYAGGNSLGAVLANEAAATAVAAATSGAEVAGKIATSGLDAMDVEFTITSSRPLTNPYIVTMTRFHAQGTKPGLVQNLVYARSLDPIDAHLSHVEFSEDGFPFNYELIDFQLHIYNRGVEVATNLAANRVELTRDEAFEYIKMEYLNSHRAATVAATPAMGRLPADLPVRLAQGKYAETFFVKVSKDGLPRDLFADAACANKIQDPFLQSVVQAIRFKPALADGKPIEGVAALNLTRLQI